MSKHEIKLLMKGLMELDKELKEGGQEYVNRLRQLAAEKELKHWIYDEESDIIRR